ncbi:MAG: GMP synthase, large subunit [Microgenomates bacterium 39_7]|nr:MAG: GMP synthase, large subunit [Microgenomates bacterium 39_7]
MIIIVDFGSQTTHLISRRLKNFGIDSKIIEPELLEDYLPQAKGVILSGGPASVYQDDSPSLTVDVNQIKVPILGICYGWQLIAHQMKGEVIPSEKEYGPVELTIKMESPLFDTIDKKKFTVWMSHADLVKTLPSGFKTTAATNSIQHAAVSNKDNKIFGVQFHPEVTHTEYGDAILQNFAQKICGLKIKKRKLDVNKVIEETKKKLENSSGTIISAISGGVDSTVASAIVAAAVGKRMVPIYCNNGLMRLGTTAQVIKIFSEHFEVDPIIVDCEDLFLDKLKGVSDPEKKRKIIGNLYIEIFEKEAAKLDNVKYLVQGTIYSDVIESKGSKNASKIKSHHNVGGLPEKMKLKLIEPLREFYKDEVRQLGEQLNLPQEVVNAQPFPGPGHAIRIIGEVNKKRLTKQQQADIIVVEVLKETGHYDHIFQSFPVMTGVNTTAVKGDGRAYAELVGLRIFDSSDIMTAGWSKLPYDVLEKISTRIVNEVPDVSRVAYDITTKPPATMEWE